MNRFAILIVFFSSLVSGQETMARIIPGIQITSVFSSDNDHGITPAVTLNSRRLMFSVGPRFVYDRMFRKKSEFYRLNRQLVIDASFRYYLLSEEKRARPFALAGAEYKYSYMSYDQDYTQSGFHTYGPIFEHSFRGQWDKKKHYFSLYGGLGIDVRIWKQLSGFASFGAGVYLSKTESKVINTETGVVEYSYKRKQDGEFTWIASAGLGYRF